MSIPRDRNLAIVFQNYALYPAHDACAGNLAFGLRICGHVPRAEIETRVAEVGATARHRRAARAQARRSSPAASASAWRSAARWSASR